MYTSCILMGVTHLNSGGTPMATPKKKRVDASPAPDVSTEGLVPVSDDQLVTMIDDLTDIVTDQHAPMINDLTDIAALWDDQLLPMISDLTEIVTWWQERKATLHQASDASRETERTTFHVERRWIEAIRRQADLDGLTITQVVNEAFRRSFEST